MKAKVLMAVVALQVAVLCYMAAEREWIMRTGTPVLLQTAPLDPRDPFRGNYVRLNYSFSQVPSARLRGGLVRSQDSKREEDRIPKDTVVYAVMRNPGGGIATFDYLTDEKPAGGLFLKGRVARYWSGRTLPVRYGIEAFFAQEEKAKELEGQRRRDGVQVPLEMEAAVSARGVTVLKGYRWCALGIGLTVDTVGQTNRQARAATAATVKLMNVSSNEIAIVDPPGGGMLELETDWTRSWGDQGWSWVMAGKPRPTVTDDDVIILKPGQQREIRVDLTQPAWFVAKEKQAARPIRELSRGEMFRLIYRPPSVESCRGLKHAALIWHGELPSSAFGGGRVD